MLQVLSWIDICAGLAAKTVARGPVVTASVDTVHFLRPCHQGSVAIIAAMVNRVFHSSMEVSIAQSAVLKALILASGSPLRMTDRMWMLIWSAMEYLVITMGLNPRTSVR